MLRPAHPDDTPALVDLTESTGVFKPHEIEALREVLEDYHEVTHTYDHRAAVWESDGERLGFVYYAPTAMTDRTWELWWIAVRPQSQSQGLGARLLALVEEAVRAAGGRLLLIETSSTPAYELTRRFYLKNGYVPVARIRDFYSDGDDKVIFWKRMAHEG